MNNYLFESKRLGFRCWNPEDSVFYTQLSQDPDVMKFFPKILSAEEAFGEMLYLNEKILKEGFGF
ncbi:MAG: GNAT family N-acetyltransferase, partial [Brevinema sp.]